jgi:hypothetical protein
MASDAIWQPWVAHNGVGVDAHRHLANTKGERLLLIKPRFLKKRRGENRGWAAKVDESEGFMERSIRAHKHNIGIDPIALEDEGDGAGG